MSAASFDSPVHGGMGARGLMAQATKGLAALAPDLIRERLCEPEFIEHFLASLEAGVRQCDRTCMRLYAEALKLVGQQVDLSVMIVNQIGVQPAVARASVESLERAKLKSPRQRAEIHAKALREMGWTVEPPAEWSEAVEVNGEPAFNVSGHGVARK